MNNIYIQSGYEGREVGQTLFHIPKEKIKFSSIDDWNGEPIIGSVEFVESLIGEQIPNYYPKFLNEYLHRNVRWIESLSEIEDIESVFLKPADRHKRFDSLVVSGMAKYDPVYFEWQRGPYWTSEIVFFEEEWRYYVANGKILCAYWYIGREKEIEAPELDIEWPDGFCGAVDFGRLSNGKIALVENNLPYACGWYGPYGEVSKYVEWLEKGFKYVFKHIN